MLGEVHPGTFGSHPEFRQSADYQFCSDILSALSDTDRLSLHISAGEKSTAVGAAVGAAMVTSALALFGISTYKRKH